ncbi:MAG: rhodanese-like domain-containing protein [Halolamina sp.]
MVDEVTPEELKRKLDADEPVQVIDIRPPGAFAKGHIPGAINVPMTELPTRVEEIDWGGDVVVTCPIGQSSVQAARLIGSFEGVDDDAEVRSMAGGYDAWEYELERGTDA